MSSPSDPYQDDGPPPLPVGNQSDEEPPPLPVASENSHQPTSLPATTEADEEPPPLPVVAGISTESPVPQVAKASGQPPIPQVANKVKVRPPTVPSGSKAEKKPSGTSLASTPLPESRPVPHEPGQRGRSWRVPLAIVAIVVLVGIGAIFFASSRGKRDVASTMGFRLGQHNKAFRQNLLPQPISSRSPTPRLRRHPQPSQSLNRSPSQRHLRSPNRNRRPNHSPNPTQSRKGWLISFRLSI